MHINDWIEIDKDLKWYIEQKTRVINEQGMSVRTTAPYSHARTLMRSMDYEGKRVVDSLPENDAACGELLEILIDYLPKRYPTLFEALPSKIKKEGFGIWNRVTDERFEYENVRGLDGVEALKVCSR